MNLKRQLLLVSLLALMLPWAGCEFIRETESALRNTQAEMLAGNARTLANLLGQFPEEFPPTTVRGDSGERMFLHPLSSRPEVDGYFADWSLKAETLTPLRGWDGPVYFAAGEFGDDVYLFVEVSDQQVVYLPEGIAADATTANSDRVQLVSATPPLSNQTLLFAAEAPGALVPILTGADAEQASAVSAFWQDTPSGYQLEARIPAYLLGANLGLVVSTPSSAGAVAARTQSFSGQEPGPLARRIPEVVERLAPFVPKGLRALVTDVEGYRIAVVGDLGATTNDNDSVWSQRVYNFLVEPGKDAALAQPAARGRERQNYINLALDGNEQTSWFRSEASGRAVVAAATPVVSDNEVIGALVLQQGTDAILSLTNSGLARLINVSILATVFVAIALLGYATWLSRRIRRLARAAEAALDGERLRLELPSAGANDEVGDLSRSFATVLRQLGEYNAYLRTLASKLSHELRTPLAIVTSSLDNLEHENVSESAQGYIQRAGDGAERLRRILNAMSEANRVEELMANADSESFDLGAVLASTITAYGDAYPQRRFAFTATDDVVMVDGAPELIVQMLDKLVDNAVSFSANGDTIVIALTADTSTRMTVANPGPPLPATMQSQLFDSMVSLRDGKDSRHLGLGLYIARLIAEGHNGRITAENTDDGVCFSVALPRRGGLVE